MRNKKMFLKMLAVILFFGGSLFLSSCEKMDVTAIEDQDSGAAATGTCSCVGYVKNRLGITGSTANANGWGRVLTARGYYAVVTPAVGDIAVFQTNFGSGIDATYGHIGIVSGASGSAGQRTITLTGANQGSRNLRTEFNCRNVNEMSVTVTNSNAGAVTFYRR